MNPRKAKELLPKVSLETGHPLEFLEDFTDFFYNYTRKMVTNLEDLRILLPDLGTLHIKGDIIVQKELDKLIPILKRYNENPPKTPIKYQRHQALIEKVNKLTKLRDEHLKRTEDKKANKQLRYEIRQSREAKEGLEKPE